MQFGRTVVVEGRMSEKSHENEHVENWKKPVHFCLLMILGPFVYFLSLVGSLSS